MAPPFQPPVDGGPGPVTVTVRGLLAPGLLVAGAPVVFVGPDGAMIETTTDDLGVARATVMPDTLVLVLRTQPFGVRQHLTALAGIDPGLELAVGAPIAAFVFPPPVGSLTLTQPPHPAAATHQFALSCSDDRGFGATSAFVSVRQCAAIADATIVSTAFGFDDELLAYGVRQGIDLRTVFGQEIDVPALFPPAIATVSVTSIPPEVLTIQVTHTLQEGLMSSSARSRAITPGSAVVTVRLPIVPVGERTVVRTTLDGIGPISNVSNLRRFEGQRLTAQLDLGATMPPFMAAPSFRSIASTSASWEYNGDGRRPTLVAIRGVYPSGGTDVGFTIIAPGDRTYLGFPPLPAVLASVVPDASFRATVSDYGGISAEGYDYRALAPTADRDIVDLAGRDDVLPAIDDLWITGPAPGLGR